MEFSIAYGGINVDLVAEEWELGFQDRGVPGLQTITKQAVAEIEGGRSHAFELQQITTTTTTSKWAVSAALSAAPSR